MKRIVRTTPPAPVEIDLAALAKRKCLPEAVRAALVAAIEAAKASAAALDMEPAIAAVEARGVIVRSGEFSIQIDRPADGWRYSVTRGPRKGSVAVHSLCVPVSPVIAVTGVSGDGQELAFTGTAEITVDLPEHVDPKVIRIDVLAGFEGALPHLVETAIAAALVAPDRAGLIEKSLSPWLPRTGRI